MKILNNYLLCIFFILSFINNIKVVDSQKIRVTCVGDSITHGVGASDNDHTYPSQLQRILGDKFEVINKGVSGAKVTRSDGRSYAKSQKYLEGLQSNPDIVIILLGTDDMTTEEIETEEGKRLFRQDYELLINEYKNCGSNPKIMIVPPISSVDENNKHDNRDRIVERVQIPLIKSIAKKYGLTYLDGHFYTKRWTRNEIGDGLHPNDSGYEKLAKYFANAILGYVGDFNGEVEEYRNYNIQSKANNKIMSIRDESFAVEAEVILDEDHNHWANWFCFIDAGDGYYRILNYKSYLFLNVAGGSGNEGANIIQFT